MDIKAFLRQNAIPAVNKKLVVSPRFIDEDKKPVEWELRPISEGENSKIRESCTARTVFQGRQTANFNSNRYLNALCVASVVYPDLKNADLQRSYGVTDAEDLLSTMLLPGEYTELLQYVQSVNGYTSETFQEAKTEIKNS